MLDHEIRGQLACRGPCPWRRRVTSGSDAITSVAASGIEREQGCIDAKRHRSLVRSIQAQHSGLAGIGSMARTTRDGFTGQSQPKDRRRWRPGAVAPQRGAVTWFRIRAPLNFHLGGCALRGGHAPARGEWGLCRGHLPPAVLRDGTWIRRIDAECEGTRRHVAFDRQIVALSPAVRRCRDEG